MGSTGLVSENIVRWIRAFASPALAVDPGTGASELALDTATGTLKYAVGGATKEVGDLSTAQTVTGAKTFSGAVAFTGTVAGERGSVSVTLADTIAITAAMSGTTFIATKTSATQVFTLPAAATPGLVYRFVCAHASGEIHVGVATGDNIIGKTHGANDATGLLSTATTGLLKNTAATNVVGDFTALVSDGLTTWYMVAVAGVWSAT